MAYRDPEQQTAEMDALFTAVAGLMRLDGWTVKRDENGSGTYREYVLERAGMTINFRREHAGNADKVGIATWGWPEYRYTEHGQLRTKRVTPMDLWDPKESSPSISCSISRGADAIVKDLKRRFLPEYERIYARCQAKADATTKHNEESDQTWAAICATVGKKPTSGQHYLDGGCEIERRYSGNAKLTIDEVTPETLAQVLAVLKGGK